MVIIVLFFAFFLQRKISIFTLLRAQPTTISKNDLKPQIRSQTTYTISNHDHNLKTTKSTIKYNFQQIRTTTFTISDFEVDNGVTNQVVRGVKAKTNIQTGDELVSVPENMLFTSSRIAKRWPRVYSLPNFRKNVVLEMGHSKKVALLSYGLWLERFANRTKWRDPNIEIDLEPFLKSLPERAKEVEISDDELKQDFVGSQRR